MERALKNFCKEQYSSCKNYGGDIEKAIDRCYGALLFCINNCFPSYHSELGNWWDDEMLPKFRELQIERIKNYAGTY